MSDLGLFAARLHQSTDSLRRFDEAMRYFKKVNAREDSAEAPNQLRKLTFVLEPIAELLNGKLSRVTGFDEKSIVEILHLRHSKDWQEYREHILSLAARLESGHTSFDTHEFELLNDVADAVDSECATLFKRISGRV